MARKVLDPEEIFLDTIKLLIKNMFIENKNFNNGHYFPPKNQDGVADLMRNVRLNGEILLARIEQMEHLVRTTND